MEFLTKSLRLLQSSQYFRAIPKDYTILENAELLPNGQQLAQLLAKHWMKVNENIPILHLKTSEDVQPNPIQKFNFIHTTQFAEYLKVLCKLKEIQCPSVTKFISNGRFVQSRKAENTIEILNRTEFGSFLVADYFVHPSCGLEQFFSIQRRRKIWWMQCSANSSRYFFQPYDHCESEKSKYANCSSIIIKARFPMGTIDVEDITLIPIKEFQLEELESFKLWNEHTKEEVVPALVRSVINLEAATCALLFDSCDNNRSDTLLLNRKLAPYQFLIAGYHSGRNVVDLHDLCKHLSNEVRFAGLRIFSNGTPVTNSKDEVIKELRIADSYGIPYSLIIDENTLSTGIIKLRSRDTTLEETIHISDVPNYFKNIFNLNSSNKST